MHSKRHRCHCRSDNWTSFTVDTAVSPRDQTWPCQLR